jgi:hypothetical protein
MTNHKTSQLHGFCDASEKTYGACLYLRSTDHRGRLSCKLLCSKSRVAPVRKVTLPRLELCGAVLLAKLIKRTVPVLAVPIHSIHLFTDSTVVLAWIMATPTRWKTFVANRVAQIQEHTSIECWRYVSTHENPADLISRGADPATLLEAQIWWKGPEWLQHKQEVWKETTPERLPEDIPEERPVTSLLTTSASSDDMIMKFSSYSKLIRVIAWCRRFIHNCRLPSDRLNQPISSSEF